MWLLEPDNYAATKLPSATFRGSVLSFYRRAVMRPPSQQAKGLGTDTDIQPSHTFLKIVNVLRLWRKGGHSATKDLEKHAPLPQRSDPK